MKEWIESLPLLLTRKEFADVVRRGVKTIRRWEQVGIISAVYLPSGEDGRLNGRYGAGSSTVLYPRSELERVITDGIDAKRGQPTNAEYRYTIDEFIDILSAGGESLQQYSGDELRGWLKDKIERKEP